MNRTGYANRGFAAAHGGKAPPFRWRLIDESRLCLERRQSRIGSARPPNRKNRKPDLKISQEISLKITRSLPFRVLTPL